MAGVFPQQGACPSAQSAGDYLERGCRPHLDEGETALAENQFVQHVAMGDVHVLRLANPPVNTLRTEIRAGLYDGMKAARATGAKAVVIIGTGRMFCAGAEMTEFGKPRVPPSLTEVFEQFESFPGITVAAIHGSALGGGLEVALACHARVAVADANSACRK